MRSGVLGCAAALLAAGSALCGCSTLMSVEAGYQQPYDQELAPGHRGLAFDIHFGMSAGDVPAGAELALLTKHGGELGQWALAAGVYAFTPPAVIGAFGRAGLAVLQFGSWSDAFTFGMGSPWVQGGLYILPEAMGRGGGSLNLSRFGGLVFLFGASTGYDLRFGTAAPDSGWWSITAGLGFLSEVGR